MYVCKGARAAGFALLHTVFAVTLSVFLLSLCWTSAVLAEDAAKRSGKPIIVDSDTMEADNNKNIIIFRGNVVAREDFTICSDELTVIYGEGKEVREIVALGTVRIVKGDKTATSDKAVYDRAKGTIVLTGKPRVTQCKDSIEGEKITFHVDNDNAFVQGSGKQRVRAVIMPGKDKDCQESVKVEEGSCRGAR